MDSTLDTSRPPAAATAAPSSAGQCVSPSRLDLSSLRNDNDATTTPSTPTLDKRRVEFDGICMVIPNVDHKQLRKLLRMYALGCDKIRDERGAAAAGAGVAGAPADGGTIPSLTAATKAPVTRPRYAMRVVSVPLSPGQWGAGNLRSSLANLNLSFKIDLNVVASGLAPANGGWAVSGNYRASSSFTSVNDIHERERQELDADRNRRAHSFSDHDGDRRRRTGAGLPCPTRSSSDEPASPAEAHETPPIQRAQSPRMLRMKIPTFGGWRKCVALADPPPKGCLLNRKRSVPLAAAAAGTASAATSVAQRTTSPSPFHEASDSSHLRKCYEGPPVRETRAERSNVAQPRPPNARVVSQVAPIKTQGPTGLRRASSLGRRSSTRRESSEQSVLEDACCSGSSVDLHGQPQQQQPPQAQLQEELDEAGIKRELKAGRWPFQEPLNPECNCKDCSKSISLVNDRGYKAHWTRSARAKWLTDRKEREAQERMHGSNGGNPSPGAHANGTGHGSDRPTSRGRIQADEVDVKLGTGSRPLTPEGEEDEPESDAAAVGGMSADRKGPESADAVLTPIAVAIATASPRGATAAPPEKPPTGPKLVAPVAIPAVMLPNAELDADEYVEGDEQLEREIDSRRTSVESRHSYRPGARSMLRQLDEADRVERQASVERERRRNSMSPTMSPRPTPSPRPSPQQHGDGGSGSSYFDLPRRGSPRLTLGPIAEGGIGRSQDAGEGIGRPRLSPLRNERGPLEDVAAHHRLAQVDQLPQRGEASSPTPRTDAKGKVAKSSSGIGGSVRRKASKSFFGLLGSSFGGTCAPPG